MSSTLYWDILPSTQAPKTAESWSVWRGPSSFAKYSLLTSAIKTSQFFTTSTWKSMRAKVLQLSGRVAAVNQPSSDLCYDFMILTKAKSLLMAKALLIHKMYRGGSLFLSCQSLRTWTSKEHSTPSWLGVSSLDFSPTWRRQIGYVAQEPFLFPGTIRGKLFSSFSLSYVLKLS